MSYKHPSEELATALEEDCCNTTCLVQPRFFHGQLLTDADLNQLLSWAEAKFRLHRPMNGWGIVCGLQLSLDPEHPAHIVVHPGQGIDCCGRDLVVCEPTSIDLSEACPQEECLEPGYNRWGKPTGEASARTSEQDAYEAPEVSPPSLLTLFEGSQVLDLFLHYSTEGNDSQVRLGSSYGGSSSACEYSRLKETVTLTWEEASDPLADESQRRDKFEKAFDGMRLASIERLRIARGRAENQESLRSWLLERLDAQPLQEFGFVRDWITSTEANDLSNHAARILFLMGMDALLAGLRCSCPGCSSETGIRVGRVWLQGPGAAGGDHCRIISVNSQPPYRRELRSEPCYPTSPGCVNLAPYLWKDWGVVRDSLTGLGVTVGDVHDRTFADLNWDMLDEIYKQTDRIVNCDEYGNPVPIRATVVHLDPPFNDRVVGFTF